MIEEPSATAHDAEVLGRVVALLRRADLALQSTKEPPLRKLGITGSLYAVLANLQVSPGLTSAELARVVGVTPQAIQPLVGKLVDRGWLERRPHPRHANVQELHLTDSGRQELAGADKLLFHLEGHLRTSLGEENHQLLQVLLGGVIEHLATWTPPS